MNDALLIGLGRRNSQSNLWFTARRNHLLVLIRSIDNQFDGKRNVKGRFKIPHLVDTKVCIVTFPQEHKNYSYSNVYLIFIQVVTIHVPSLLYSSLGRCIACINLVLKNIVVLQRTCFNSLLCMQSAINFVSVREFPANIIILFIW